MHATLQGLDIYYDDSGKGIPLLLMHAFPLHRGMFSAIPGARLVTFDAPGAGKSALPVCPLSMDTLADIAAALLDHLGIERAVVGGVSMGGYAAFRFVRRYPWRLQGLVLCSTRVAADTPEARAGRLEMRDAARRDGAAEIAGRMIPRLLGETTRRNNPDVVGRVQEMIQAAAPEGIARLLEALAAREESSGVLAGIDVPTLVMAGEEDLISTPEESQQWTSQIPGARFVVVPACGHLPPLEQPDRFRQAVEEFLSVIPRPAERVTGA